MRKIAYIIPGYGEYYKHQQSYNKVAKFFLAKGIEPIHIKIDWHSRKPRRLRYYIAQFLKQYKKPHNARVFVLGFSLGAVVAFLSEAKTHPDTLILCSLSPYFKEDFQKLQPKWLRWWKKSFKGSDYSFNEVARKIKARIILIAGDKEGPEVERRIRSAMITLKKRSFYRAKGAKHDLRQKKYLAVVKKIIDQL